MKSGLAPYVLGGLGLVRVSPGDDLLLDPSGDLTRLEEFTKLAGQLGAGVSHRLAGSPVTVYLQGTGWIYNWNQYGLDDTRLDVTWSAGIGSRFGL
jgi:hypothetical protein